MDIHRGESYVDDSDSVYPDFFQYFIFIACEESDEKRKLTSVDISGNVPR